MFLLAAAANRPVRRIRCVGFGSVATSKTTQSHLNVAIMIAKCLRCLKVTVCDPAMQDSDMNLIRQHGFVIESDATVKRDLDEAGVDVLFMPFCDVTLYVLVLQTYIENGLAGNVVLFGKYFIRLANVGGCYGEAIKVMLRNRVVRQYCLPPILRQPSYEPLDGLCISILEQPSGKVYDACVAEFKKIKEKEKPLE